MLKVQQVRKTFYPGTVNERQALKDCSLEVPKGEFVCLAGANGSGKSTLFSIVAGSLFPDGGRVYLDGEDVTYTPEHVRAKSIGRLFQDPSMGTAPSLTIEENLTLAGSSGGWLQTLPSKDRELFRQALEQLGMGLENRLKTPVGLLSGGQRQALALVMATYHPPKLLLLDEHTTALDPASAERIMELTRTIVREQGVTCLMVSHNLNHLQKEGDRLVILKDGQIGVDLKGEERLQISKEELLNSIQ